MSKVLITGGSGFLGRNLALRLKGRHEVILASRNQKNNQFAESVTGCRSVPMDISNFGSVYDIISEFRPEIIIHAGAGKFVDKAEVFPMETVDVNIIGSQNVARAAMQLGVQFVLGISTDKACEPKNIYGISKAAMERMFCLINGKTDTQFACVRYGNVCWSTGSVLPIWKQMHLRTGVIGTTGPEMRRFFFTIDHAVNLVETALNNRALVAGKILSREMKACKIRDLLDTWIKSSGGSWEHIDGRPGEKMDECLVGAAELPYCESLSFDGVKHFLISPNIRVKNPLSEPFSSLNAEPMTEGEMLDVIKADPDV